MHGCLQNLSCIFDSQNKTTNETEQRWLDQYRPNNCSD